MFKHNHFTAFIKVSLFTTMVFGGLLAQSWATTQFSDAVMKMNIEFVATEGDKPGTQSTTQKASMTVHNEQESSIAFGDHQLDIKTTFFGWEDDAKEHEQVLAEIKIQKLAEDGQYHLVTAPSLLIDRNEWAAVTIDALQGEAAIELKMQFKDLIRAQAAAAIESAHSLNKPTSGPTSGD